MPRKKSATDDDAPRRRGARATSAVAVAEIEAERNLLVRVLLHSPKDTLAGLVAFAAVCAIIGNALFLQTGRHPAPMFGTVINLPAPPSMAFSSPLPRPRPLGADALPLEPKPMEFRAAEPKAPERAAPERTVEKPAEQTTSTSRSADPLTNLVKATTSTPSQSVVVARPPAPIPAAQSPGARRIAAAQRALAETGYGQLKVTGAMSAETQAAIQRFERGHNMPVTGQVSDRLLRELATVIGHPVD